MKRCRQCQAKFTPTRDWQSFCRPDCRVEWYQQLHAAYRQVRKDKIQSTKARRPTR